MLRVSMVLNMFRDTWGIHFGNFYRNSIWAQESPNSKTSAESRKVRRQFPILRKYIVLWIQSWVRVIPPKSWAILPKSWAIPPTFFWLYWGTYSTINSAEIGLQYWNSAESRFWAKSQNSAEIPKRQKLLYIWSLQVLINLNFELVDHFETQEIISALVRKTVCIAVAQNQHVFRFISLRVRARFYHVTWCSHLWNHLRLSEEYWTQMRWFLRPAIPYFNIHEPDASKRRKSWTYHQDHLRSSPKYPIQIH